VSTLIVCVVLLRLLLLPAAFLPFSQLEWISQSLDLSWGFSSLLAED
jgi:hypothetical protein